MKQTETYIEAPEYHSKDGYSDDASFSLICWGEEEEQWKEKTKKKLANIGRRQSHYSSRDSHGTYLKRVRKLTKTCFSTNISNDLS